MIGLNAPNLPPVTLTDEAMKLCATIMAIAADPNAAQARLTEIDTATKAYRATIDEHAAAKKSADDAAAALADVEQRSRDLAAREESLLKATTQLSVSRTTLTLLAKKV